MEGSDWRTSAHIPKESPHTQDEVTPVNEGNQEQDEESEQDNEVVEDTYDDDGQESIASGKSHSMEEEDDNIVTTKVSTFGMVRWNK